MEKIARTLVSARHFQRMFSMSDCLVGMRSLLTIPDVASTPQIRISFSLTIAGHSLSPCHETGLVAPLCAPSLNSPIVCCCCRMGCNPRTCGLLWVPEVPTRVRFPLALPHSLNCREVRLQSSQNRAKSPQFRTFSLSNRTGESALRNAAGEHYGHFLRNIRAVRFRRLYAANALRSKIDEEAKARLTFVRLRKCCR